MSSSPPYPPFSGDDAVCGKCGHTSVSTSYQPYGRLVASGPALVVLGYSPPDWLARTCARCDHVWAEACLDAEETDRG